MTPRTAHRNAECLLEPGEVELAAAGVELVGHGHDQAGGQILLQRLRHEQQRALQAAGIGHQHQRLRRRRELAREHARHDRLVRAQRIEAVGAG
jgi:hypothetical protein